MFRRNFSLEGRELNPAPTDPDKARQEIQRYEKAGNIEMVAALSLKLGGYYFTHGEFEKAGEFYGKAISGLGQLPDRERDFAEALYRKVESNFNAGCDREGLNVEVRQAQEKLRCLLETVKEGLKESKDTFVVGRRQTIKAMEEYLDRIGDFMPPSESSEYWAKWNWA